MALLFTFTTDAVGDDEPIIANVYCRKVTIYELNFGATAGFTIRCPGIADEAVPFPAGTILEFTPPDGSVRQSFYPGQVIGYIAADSGTLTMVQKEE